MTDKAFLLYFFLSLGGNPIQNKACQQHDRAETNFWQHLLQVDRPPRQLFPVCVHFSTLPDHDYTPILYHLHRTHLAYWESPLLSEFFLHCSQTIFGHRCSYQSAFVICEANVSWLTCRLISCAAPSVTLMTLGYVIHHPIDSLFPLTYFCHDTRSPTIHTYLDTNLDIITDFRNSSPCFAQGCK